ncbi:arylsulfatase [Singulisphaera acidiphila]|uniref:Arylsulfatase A family protein n=1 Tax=Singulisphaera acidiphila (strain ATCC BAA-1392 / DSM 18658 / VKM B-2454 / MOB10) TaxID=886293 RepID=L0DEI6_SINAD|nr:arylsulfatase [Singulisphaera acidiphila]AGA27071.1 arylsulfatase A family protein [Singulisphaera acidiphila DSM 18658]
MRMPTFLATARVVAGALIGWAIVAPLVPRARAEDKPDDLQTANSPVLPPPAAEFRGRIGRTYKDSTPGTFPVVKAPANAPNVLVVLIDDSGFGQWGTFGGQVPTPNLDKLAAQGLKYNRFHTTALCSPTRAALLTGRNHHSAATGNITELGSSYPGYTGQIPKSCAMVSEIVRQNGYSTAFFGKNHNIADWETSVSGPYDRWPGLQGFDHFYGFVGGESNQWQPALYDGNTPVEMKPPKGREADYTLNEHLADKAIDYLHQQKSVTPDRPFFLYYAPGATHAPHHVPKSWLAKFGGQFDRGWDVYREETFARQKQLGVIPAETKLTPRPKEIPAWDTLTVPQKQVAARLMEAFAAYTAQTDQEVGRVIDAIEEIGQRENTLIFWEVGDNGSSMEGSLYGLFNEMVGLGGEQEDPAYIHAHLDEIGGPKSYNHFPVGWAWAMNTPFQWGKQVASHLGGVRNPLVVSWPKRIKDKGGVRSQFHHVIDLAPTILEAAGIREPAEVNGVAQKPIEGVSMAYSFADSKAKSPRQTQYFEMFGNRALYDDGWIATCRHGRLPWENSGGSDFAKDEWQLYHLEDDFSEANDLAATHPQRLRDLQDRFWVEAAKYNVLPLDDRFIERADPAMRPSLIAGRTHFLYFPGARRIPESSSPNIKNKSHSITAHIVIPEDGATGTLVAAGGVVGGYTLFIKEGKPVYEYNRFTQDRYKVSGSERLAPGKHSIRVEFKYDGGGLGKGGVVTLLVDAQKVAEGRVEKTISGRFSADETFDTGLDTGSPVSDAYESPFQFTGTIQRVEIELGTDNLSQTDVERLRQIESTRRISN